MDKSQLQLALPNAALAFRGYNVTNLGRTPELLACDASRPILVSVLQKASEASSDILGRKVDLVGRVQTQQETNLATYAEAIALILAVGSAQLKILEQIFEVDYHAAKLSMGYSLGEIAALIAGGSITLEDALVAPLTLADDCVALADDVTLGVLFSRDTAVPIDDLKHCEQVVNQQGRGVVGASAYLSPNSLLMMGQQDTLERLKECLQATGCQRVVLRKKDNQWPPMHTPIVWQKNIPNRSAQIMHTVPLSGQPPHPSVLSMVTGELSYTSNNIRQLLHQWVDHPQRLWDVICKAMAMRVETMVHIGPQPNIIPATMRRLHDNVIAETKGSLGMQVLSVAAHRRWLHSLLPQRTALLRAASINQIVLEDWLLEHQPN